MKHLHLLLQSAKSRSQDFIILVSISVLGISAATLTHTVYAETLESPNYKIEGATLNSGGQPVDSGTGNLSLFASIGDFSSQPRSNSTSYQIRPGSAEIFLANTPKIQCFETDTSGSSNCQSAPASVVANGIVRACGDDGCYNRARFEIDTQNNPDDTLYSAQISYDSFTTYEVIDGVTFSPKSPSDKSLNDYLSKSAWESPTFNLRNLRADTTYQLRLTALQGDFTESSPSPVAQATTALPNIDVDIDITDTAETTPETASPYTLSFTGDYRLIAGGSPITTPDLIWVDISTNGNFGSSLTVRSANHAGLYSPSETYTIPSTDTDLASTSEGYGLQIYSTSEQYTGGVDGILTTLDPQAPYAGSGENVGGLPLSFSKILDSSGPLSSGRAGFYVKARAGNSTPGATDYTSTLIFVAVGRY